MLFLYVEDLRRDTGMAWKFKGYTARQCMYLGLPRSIYIKKDENRFSRRILRIREER